MNNAMKKMMALLLALVMVLLASPFAVLAEGGITEPAETVVQESDGLIEETLTPVEPETEESAETTPVVNVSNTVTAVNLLASGDAVVETEPTYLERIAALQAEAEALDPASETLQADCADIYARLMAVYEPAAAEYQAGTMTEEEYNEIYNAVGVVVGILYGYGYDPYAVVTNANYGTITYDNDSINVYFIDENGVAIDLSTTTYSMTSNPVEMADVGARFENNEYSYVESHANSSDGTTFTYLRRRNSDGWRYSNSNSPNGGSYISRVYMVFASNSIQDVSISVMQGSSATLSVANAGSYEYDFTKLPEGLAVTYDNSSITVTADKTVAAGTYTAGYSDAEENTKTITIEVTVPEKIKVYVYVASEDSSGTSWQDNEEFQELIGLYVCDTNGYFPAGYIYLDETYFEGKTGYDTSGAALINSSDDWTQLLSALSGMSASGMSGSTGAAWCHSEKTLNFSHNNGNSVSDYLSQASKDIGQSWGSQKSALFRWHENNSDHCGYPDDSTTKYHLDLCFNLNKITFITGNNGITSGVAQDGTEVDYRAYITGSLIQPPRDLEIPDGYQFVGYYKDADFTEPWDELYQPLTTDQVVYLKITPLENVVVQYVVADGEGTVDSDNEAFNPVTGVPLGSTATASDGWSFEGWYADEECTQMLSSEAKYTPEEPEGGWVAGTTYYYYAKFVPATTSVSITKTVTGNMGDWNKSFGFTAVIKNGDTVLTDDQLANVSGPAGNFSVDTGTGEISFSLSHSGSITINGLPIGHTIVVTEEATAYVTTVAGADAAASPADSNCVATATVAADGATSITFTNDKTATVDTGILLDSLPYVVILAAVGAALVLWFVRKRRVDD